MKITTVLVLSILLGSLYTRAAYSQETVAIGKFATVESDKPSVVGYGGMEMFTIFAKEGDKSPFTRSAECDARLVEIFARSSRRVKASDVKVVSKKSKLCVVVRGIMWVNVTSQDASSKEGRQQLASQWANAARKYLPKISNGDNE